MGHGIVDLLHANNLRNAFRAEIDAAATVRKLEARKVAAEKAVAERRVERGNIPRRAAQDASVTGSDLRKADAALADAEAELELVTAAIPHAIGFARAAVLAAHAAAKDAAERMPDASAEELDAFLDRHGRDRFVADRARRFGVMEEVKG